MQQGQYPNAFYRVSIKAVIANERGEVLVVREGDDWTLPGGGLDHGEDPATALKRELYEEALITSDFEVKLLGTESFYAKSKQAMAFWMIYKVTVNEADFAYGIGEDSDEVAYKNPRGFQGSGSLFEQMIYKYGSLTDLN